MRIIHVISALTKGGGERVAQELAEAGLRRGHQVTILAGWPTDPALLQDRISPGIDVRFVGQTKFQAYLLTFFWILRNRDWLKRTDVLHSHLTFGAFFGVIARLVLRCLLKCNSISFVETYHAVGMKISPVVRDIHYRMMQFRDGVIMMATDPSWDSFFQKNPDIAWTLIRNGISVPESIEEPAACRAKLPIANLKPSTVLIGSIGVLRPDRKPTLYIPLFVEVLKLMQDTDIQFVLGGDGTERAELERLVEQESIKGKFHLLGMVQNPAELYPAFDIYISVCVGNVGGLSIIEAAMCRTPIVGIQLLEMYEANEKDWIWTHSDLKALAAKIAELVSDKKNLAALAEEQERHAHENFSSNAMYSRYVDFYASLKRQREPRNPRSSLGSS